MTSKRDRTITVSLTDFGVFYRQEDLDALTADMRPGSRVTVDKGRVVKVTKSKSGEVTEEVLTGTWTDWIDYWAVDFDYASRPETIYETVILRDGDGVVWIVETKGREDVQDARKWDRLKLWCQDATEQDAPRTYRAMFVRQEEWEALLNPLHRFAGAVAVFGEP